MKLLVFDCETTGIDPENDRIVELSILRVDPVEPTEYNEYSRFEVRSTYTSMYNPGIPISAGATSAHGYSNADVQDKPSFAEDAAMVQTIVEAPGAVLVGYNSSQFDIIILDAELRRHGQEGIDLSVVDEIDLLQVWRKWEGKTLEDALRRFRNKKIEGAHNAEADVRTTIEVLDGVCGVTGMSLQEMIESSRPVLDRFGKLMFDEEGDICLTFGKHRGEKCRNIDVSYLKWMSSANFPASTMDILRRAWKNDWQL